MAANFFVPQAVCSEVVSCNAPPLTATAPGNAATDGPSHAHTNADHDVGSPADAGKFSIAGSDNVSEHARPPWYIG